VTGLAGVLGLVDAEHRAAFGAVDEHSGVTDLGRRLQAEGVGVERSSSREISGRDVGGDGCICEHGILLRADNVMVRGRPAAAPGCAERSAGVWLRRAGVDPLP
jgi:hypothetical protein